MASLGRNAATLGHERSDAWWCLLSQWQAARVAVSDELLDALAAYTTAGAV